MLQFFIDYLLFPIVVLGEFTFLFYVGLPSEAKKPQQAPARAERPAVGAPAATAH